jgi:heterodisulfide reductase subunit A
VEGVEGFVGNFKVKVKHNPRYVDPEKCTCCKKCEEVCPVLVADEHNMGLTKRRAIYLPSPYAVPFSYRIDSKNCTRISRGECAKCKEICPPGAIRFEEAGANVQIDVGTIIIATGYDHFDPRLKP